MREENGKEAEQGSTIGTWITVFVKAIEGWLIGAWKEHGSKIKQPTSDGIFGKFLNLRKMQMSHLPHEKNRTSHMSTGGGGGLEKEYKHLDDTQGSAGTRQAITIIRCH